MGELKDYLRSKLNTTAKQDRRARTRTLIQLGGLIEKSGLMNLIHIQTGEDLQLDHEAYEKAATLFEILSNTYIQHENTIKRETSALFEALHEQSLSTGLIITRDQEMEIKSEDKTIFVIPIWRFLIQKDIFTI